MTTPYLGTLAELVGRRTLPGATPRETPEELRRLAAQARRQHDIRSAEAYERRAAELERVARAIPAVAADATAVARPTPTRRADLASLPGFAPDASATDRMAPEPAVATPRQQREPERAPPAVQAEATAVPDRPRVDLARLRALRAAEAAAQGGAIQRPAIARPAASERRVAGLPEASEAAPRQPATLRATDAGQASRSAEEMRQLAELADRQANELEREGQTADAMRQRDVARRLRHQAEIAGAYRGGPVGPFVAEAASAASWLGTLGAVDPLRRTRNLREQSLLEARHGATLDQATPRPALPITASGGAPLPAGATTPIREGAGAAVSERELADAGLLGRGELVTPRLLGREGDDRQRLLGQLAGSLLAGGPLLALERGAIAAATAGRTVNAATAAARGSATGRIARGMADLAVPGAIADVNEALASGRDPMEAALVGAAYGALIGAPFDAAGVAVDAARTRLGRGAAAADLPLEPPPVRQEAPGATIPPSAAPTPGSVLEGASGAMARPSPLAARPGVVGEVPFRERPEAASALAERADANGGFTVDPTTGDDVAGGYAVGLGRAGARVVSTPQLDEGAVRRMIDGNRALFESGNPRVKLGGWKDEAGVYHLEASEVFDTPADAFRAARERNEDAIFDLNSFTTVWLKPWLAPEGATLAPPEFQIARRPLALEHYSRRGDLTELDPAFMGTGAAGAERARPGRPPALHFYREGARPEPQFRGAGVSRYRTQLFEDQLYDVARDELGIVRDWREAAAARGERPDVDVLERQLAERGLFYFDPERPDIIKGFSRVPVERVGAATAARGARPGFVGDRPAAPGAEPAAAAPAPAAYRNQPDFYSPARRAVEQAPQRRGDANYWRAVVSKAASQNELAATGILDWLAEPAQQRGALTREQVLARLDARPLVLEETYLGPPRRTAEQRARREELRRVVDAADAELTHARRERQAAVDRLSQALRPGGDASPRLRALHEQMIAELSTGPVRSVPELVLLTETYTTRMLNELDPAIERRMAEAERAWRAANDEWTAWRSTLPDERNPRYRDFTAPGGENPREILIRTPTREGEPAYQGQHWAEPNVVAHVRTTDRTLPDGGRVLHIEEIQSDWHQAGRLQGYQLDPGTLRQLREHADAVGREYDAVVRAYEELGRRVSRLRSEALQANRPLEERQRLTDEYRRLEAEEVAPIRARYEALREQYIAARDLVEANERGVPAGPYRKTDEWTGLALRRAIAEAVAGGYDAISLTTPTQTPALVGMPREAAARYYGDLVPKLLREELRRLGVKQPVIERAEVTDVPGDGTYRYVGDEPDPALLRQLADQAAEVGHDDYADMIYTIARDLRGGESFAGQLQRLAAEGDAIPARRLARAVGGTLERAPDEGNLVLRITPELRAAVRSRGLRVGAVGDQPGRSIQRIPEGTPSTLASRQPIPAEAPATPRTPTDVLLTHIPPYRGRQGARNINEVGRLLASVSGESLEGAPYSRMLERARERIMPEVRDAIVHTPDAASWYGESIARMEHAIRSIFPRTADPTQMKLFKFIVAVTSSGLKPMANLRTAIGVYENYLTTGRLSFFAVEPAVEKNKAGGNRYLGELAPSVKTWGATVRIGVQEDGFKSLMRAVAARGGDDAALGAVLDELLTTRVARTQRQQSSRERVAFDLPLAATAFGNWPKIGRFFANLNGISTEVTVDLWAVRTLRGWLGYTRDAKRPNGQWETTAPDDFEGHVMRQAVAEAARQLSEETGQRFTPMDVQALLWYYEKERFARLGAKDSEQVDYAQAAEVAALEYRPGGGRDRTAARAVREAHLDAGGRAAGRRGRRAPGEGAGAARGGSAGRVGNTALRQLGLFVAPGLGGAAGAALAESAEELEASAGTGALAGLGLGLFTAGRGRGRLRGAGQARGPIGGSFRPAGAEPEPAGARAGRAGTVRGEPPRRRDAPGTEYRAEVDEGTDPRLVNLAKFDLDPTGREYLRTVALAQGYPKRRVTWDETRQVASELGLDAGALLRVDRQMTAAELLAMRDVISENVARIEQVANVLADPTISAADREVAERLLGRLETQNEQFLARFIKEREAAGRALNALKIVARRTMDPVTWTVQAQRIKGLPLSGEEVLEIRRLTSAGDRAGLVAFVSALRRSSPLDKALTLWRAGLLTAPTTHLANIVGNTSMAAMETLKEPIAAVIDAMIATARQRPRAKAVSFAGLFSEQARGFRRGVEAAREVWRSGIRPEDAEKWDVRRTNFDSPILQAYTDAVFNSLSAEDQLFRGAALGRALAEHARLRAADEARLDPAAPQPGTPAYGRRVAALAAQPPDELMLRAIADAEIAVFQNENPLARWINSADRAFEREPLLRAAKNVTMPFVRTPTNIAARLFDYSPAGLATALYRQVKSPDAKRLAEDLARSATGSGLVLFGWLLAEEGKATGSAPMNASERAQWMLEGKGANSVLIDGQWVQLGRITPAGMLVALGAQLQQTWSTRESTSGGLGGMALAPVRTATDQTFLRGVSESLGALNDPVRYGESYVSGLAGSLVPAVVARAARAFTETERTGSGVAERLASRTIRSAAPERLDVLGRPAPTPGGSLPGRLLLALFDPFNSRPSTDSPLLAEMRRLGVTVGYPARSVTDPTARASARTRRGPAAKATRRTDDELREAIRVQGPALEAALTQLIETPEYQAWGDPVKIALLAAVEGRVRAEGEAVLAGRQRSIAPPEELVAESIAGVARATLAARERDARDRAIVAYREGGLGALDAFPPAVRLEALRGLLRERRQGSPALSIRERLQAERDIRTLTRQEQRSAPVPQEPRP